MSEITIGKPVPVRTNVLASDLKEPLSPARLIAKAAMISAVVGMGAAMAGTTGAWMDMLHHKDAAELIFTAMQPVVDAGAHLYRAVYDLLGGVPIEGDLLPNNDIADKVNLASGGLAMVSAISLVIGHKMNEMLDNLDWKKAVESNRDEQHAHESQ